MKHNAYIMTCHQKDEVLKNYLRYINIFNVRIMEFGLCMDAIKILQNQKCNLNLN